MCVCERERERERDEGVCVCVCVCVCAVLSIVERLQRKLSGKRGERDAQNKQQGYMDCAERM